MRDYILLDIQSYSLKKKNEYDKYKMKKFQMNDKLYVGKDIVLDFKDSKLKVKLESIEKIDDTNKVFFLNTNKFCASIQVADYYREINNINN